VSTGKLQSPDMGVAPPASTVLAKPIRITVEAVVTRADGTQESLGTVAEWRRKENVLWRLFKSIRDALSSRAGS
jgi:hypothetical protein